MCLWRLGALPLAFGGLVLFPVDWRILVFGSAIAHTDVLANTLQLCCTAIHVFLFVRSTLYLW